MLNLLDVDDVSNSNKMIVLLKILEISRSMGDKIIVFSRSIPTLNYIEATISKAPYKYKYLRFDGKLSFYIEAKYIRANSSSQEAAIDNRI